MRDFTIEMFKHLCMAFKHAEYEFITFSDYCARTGHSEFVILRHDVDRSPRRALRMAQCEKEMNIRSSYYFRIVKPSYDEKIIKKIAEMGHEVGYHYEDLTVAKGSFGQAIDAFAKNISKLRQLYPVKTMCMHGNPLSKWDNRLLWRRYDYRDFGVIGEPYFDTDYDDVLYLTDTGRSWNGSDANVRDRIHSMHSNVRFKYTIDIIHALQNHNMAKRLMINIHPQRWHDNYVPWLKELIWQNAKNIGKRILVTRQ